MYSSGESYYNDFDEVYFYTFNIAMQVQLGFIILGIAINLIAFCIWMFGPKSKTLCCATYFALNAVADFLCCTIPGISLNTVWLCAINKFKFKYPQWYADILVDIVNYT